MPNINTNFELVNFHVEFDVASVIHVHLYINGGILLLFGFENLVLLEHSLESLQRIQLITLVHFLEPKSIEHASLYNQIWTFFLYHIAFFFSELAWKIGACNFMDTKCHIATLWMHYKLQFEFR